MGTPLPPKAWTPLIDQTIPEGLRDPFFRQWITSYFEHGDLSTKDLDVISYVLPTTSRVPSIFSMSEEQQGKIMYSPPALTSDMLLMVHFSTATNASYKKAFFDKRVRQLLPALKVSMFMGDATCSFSIPAFWAAEDDDKAHGGNNADYKIVKDINHFVYFAVVDPFTKS